MLSIDIGLKHLAHCLIREKIESWDVNNLAPSYTCCSKSTHHLGELFLCKKCLATKELPQLIVLSNQHESPLGTKKEMIASLKRKWVTNSPDMIEIGKRLIQVYDTFENVTTVLVENQIGPLASKMKGIQGMVVQYWLMRGADVHCISAVNKLKLFHKGPTTYSQRKKLSIQYAKQVLANKGWDDTAFLKHKKKDDLADTLLQAFWFMEKSLL
jgi:Poxvirus A22 protein